MRIAEMICGNAPLTCFPYRSSSYLTRFFIGIDLDYAHDGSTRNVWVEGVLSDLNAKQRAAAGMPSREMIAVIEHLLHPDHFLFDPKLDRPKAIEVDDFRREDQVGFESFTEVCHFLSDFNKLLDADLLDIPLSMLLFRDSVYPWFRYTDRLEFIRNQSVDPQYESDVENWYRTRVISLKKHFDDRQRADA